MELIGSVVLAIIELRRVLPIIEVAILVVVVVAMVVVGVVGHGGDSDSGHGLLSDGSNRGSQSELGKFCEVRQTTFRVCIPPGPHFVEHYKKQTNTKSFRK